MTTTPRKRASKPRWPAAEVEYWPIGKLSPYPRNAREHPEEQIQEIVALLKEFGWTTAILVDEAGEIIAGHGRLIAAQRLAQEKVPVMVARGWSDAQKRAYRLADNAVGDKSTWSPDLVRSELADLGQMDIDLGAFGLDNLELPPIEEALAVPTRAARSKTTIFLSVANADAERARKACVVALDKAKIDHNL